MQELLKCLNESLAEINLVGVSGWVEEVRGHLIKVVIPKAKIGDTLVIESGNQKIVAEVIGFKKDLVSAMPVDHVDQIFRGATVKFGLGKNSLPVYSGLLGGTYDSMGVSLDTSHEIGEMVGSVSLYGNPVNPLRRKVINQPLMSGIWIVDCLSTLGLGQRVCVMAGSGVGKSSFISDLARNASVDITVIGLVGERGREVKEFQQWVLGDDRRKRSLLVVETSDSTPIRRVRAAFAASAYAEYFAHKGYSVLLIIDSVTRLAMAHREVMLSLGEPAAMRGFTPSTFGLLPRLFERAGNFEGLGSITAVYTVLTEGDDIHDPIADTVRSIVDGHIVLSRDLSNKALYPPVDPLQTHSRVMKQIVSSEWWSLSNVIKKSLSLYKEYEEMINLGIYKKGQNKKLDNVISLLPKIHQAFYQNSPSSYNHDEILAWLREVAHCLTDV